MPVQSYGAEYHAVSTREILLSDIFLRLADTLVEDFDVIDVLSTLASRCVDLLDAAATGILVADASGTLQVVAASSEAANVLELFQTQNEEGPCLDAFRTGQAVSSSDLQGETPWLRFAPMAVEGGFRSVHAFPMALRGGVLGSLNLFRAQSGPLDAPDELVAQALAHAATLTLLQNQAAEDSLRLTRQLQGALSSRVTIEQAKGVISEFAGIGTDEAFVRLRSLARNRNAKLTELAAAVVIRQLSPADRAELFEPAGATKPRRRSRSAAPAALPRTPS